MLQWISTSTNNSWISWSSVISQALPFGWAGWSCALAVTNESGKKNNLPLDLTKGPKFWQAKSSQRHRFFRIPGRDKVLLIFGQPSSFSEGGNLFPSRAWSSAPLIQGALHQRPRGSHIFCWLTKLHKYNFPFLKNRLRGWWWWWWWWWWIIAVQSTNGS